jgi:hypothetical protein
VYQQPNPEAWDDQPSADQAAADQTTSSSDSGSTSEPVEYVSGDATGIEQASSAADAVEPDSAATPQAPPTIGSDDGSAFLADLARAMQAAAGAERARSLEETDRRREASIAEIRTKAGLDGADIEQQAEAEITEIDAWADAQIERIREERERRIAARREKLARRLDDHRLITDRQIEAIEEAINGYRSQLDAFFRRLDGEQDPGSIARLARTRPTFPSLDVIAGRARTAATADTLGDEADSATSGPLVGVMDPEAEGSSGDRPWESPTAATPEPAEASEAPAVQQPAAASASPRSSGALLGSVPTLRPIGSWLHRDRSDEANEHE